MAKRRSNPGNMAGLMKQAQKMQEEMARATRRDLGDGI